MHIRQAVVSLHLTPLPVASKPYDYAGSQELVNTTHHVGYSASPRPSSMQHHNQYSAGQYSARPPADWSY